MDSLGNGKTYQKVRFVLGDQLNLQHSWFDNYSEGVLYVIAELVQEQTYVKHHAQKQVAFLAAMAEFANALKEEGHDVLHLTLDQTTCFNDVKSLLQTLCEETNANQLDYQRPDEYRLLSQMRQLKLKQTVCVEHDTEHFLCDFDTLLKEFLPNKATRLENFYRRMRKRYSILIDEAGEPVGGQWNFDVENRKKLKKSDIDVIPTPLVFSNSVDVYIQRLTKHNLLGFGEVSSKLLWPVNRSQSLNLLAHFCQICLPLFGTFQDAMTDNSTAQWSLYHSRLSFALNSKMLSPKEVIDTALSVYQSQPSRELLAQVEGFIRQILGWREYIRGMYWANMPGYDQCNHLKHTNQLPDFFWHAKTKMNCVHHAVHQSLQTAYAHHIQRLMVTGNWSLLAEIDPHQVHEWYLGIYIDAIEWVELPNTMGMALYADGGLIASKPYVSSGAYINRMSDYCRSCHYKVKARHGEDACPFNSLYWRFMNKHRATLTRNPRMNMVYRNWDRLAKEEQEATLEMAEYYLAHLDSL
ncbi:cryptochrome/photolyase family protein [Vibrio sp. FNV 38]|nr:cryptochrome/photolyase family protein [Vibrio sp. FNV 38]